MAQLLSSVEKWNDVGGITDTDNASLRFCDSRQPFLQLRYTDVFRELGISFVERKAESK